MSGKAATAFTERMLMMAPRERISAGKKAWVTAWVPKRLTARWRSTAAGPVRSSGTKMPALLIRMSSGPAWLAAAWTCAVLVTSSIRGVTRASGWARGWRVPASTRLAPLARASAASACPMPRLAPVTRTVLSFMVMPVAPVVFGVIGRGGQPARARAAVLAGLGGDRAGGEGRGVAADGVLGEGRAGRGAARRDH